MYHAHGILHDPIEDNAVCDAICTVTKYILGILVVIWILNSL